MIGIVQHDQKYFFVRVYGDDITVLGVFGSFRRARIAQQRYSLNNLLYGRLIRRQILQPTTISP